MPPKKSKARDSGGAESLDHTVAALARGESLSGSRRGSSGNNTLDKGLAAALAQDEGVHLDALGFEVTIFFGNVVALWLALHTIYRARAPLWAEPVLVLSAATLGKYLAIRCCVHYWGPALPPDTVGLRGAFVAARRLAHRPWRLRLSAPPSELVVAWRDARRLLLGLAGPLLVVGLQGWGLWRVALTHAPATTAYWAAPVLTSMACFGTWMPPIPDLWARGDHSALYGSASSPPSADFASFCLATVLYRVLEGAFLVLLPAALLVDPYLHYDGAFLMLLTALANVSNGFLLGAQTVALCKEALVVEAQQVGHWRRVGNIGDKEGMSSTTDDQDFSGSPPPPEWELEPPASAVAAAYAAGTAGLANEASSTSARSPLLPFDQALAAAQTTENNNSSSSRSGHSSNKGSRKSSSVGNGYLRGSRVSYRGGLWEACGRGPFTRCAPGDIAAKMIHEAWASGGGGGRSSGDAPVVSTSGTAGAEVRGSSSEGTSSSTGSVRPCTRALVVLASCQAVLVAVLLCLVTFMPQWVPFAALSIGALAGLGLIVSSAGGAKSGGDELSRDFFYRFFGPLRSTKRADDVPPISSNTQTSASKGQRTSSEAKGNGRKSTGK